MMYRSKSKKLSVIEWNYLLLHTYVTCQNNFVNCSLDISWYYQWCQCYQDTQSRGVEFGFLSKNTRALRKLRGERCVLVLSSSYLACSCTRFVLRVLWLGVLGFSCVWSSCNRFIVSIFRFVSSSVSLSFAKYKGQPAVVPAICEILLELPVLNEITNFTPQSSVEIQWRVNHVLITDHCNS